MECTERIWRRINFAIDLLVVTIFWIFLTYLIILLLNSEKLTRSFAIDAITISLEPSFFLAYFLYYLMMESIFSRTVGKFFTNTAVVDYQMKKPKFSRVLIRTLVRFIPIDLFTFFKSNPCGWHDSFSKTIVINKEN